MSVWNLLRRSKPSHLIGKAAQEQYTKDHHHHVTEEVRQRGVEHIPNLLLSQQVSRLRCNQTTMLTQISAKLFDSLVSPLNHHEVSTKASPNSETTALPIPKCCKLRALDASKATVKQPKQHFQCDRSADLNFTTRGRIVKAATASTRKIPAMKADSSSMSMSAAVRIWGLEFRIESRFLLCFLYLPSSQIAYRDLPDTFAKTYTNGFAI